MRESFVFHSEYIEDLPEEAKTTYLMYIYNYGIHGIIPELTSFELTIWKKIQRRIDFDCEEWEAEKLRRSEAGKRHKGNQYTKKNEMEQCSKKMEQMEQCSNSSNSMEHLEQGGTNGTVSVSVSDTVSVNESVYLSVSDNVSEAEQQTEQTEELHRIVNSLFNWKKYLLSSDFADNVLSLTESNNAKIDKYLKYVFDKAKEKNPRSLKNMFFRMAQNEGTMAEFLSQTKIVYKAVKVTCPVCGAKKQDEYGNCTECDFSMINRENPEQIRFWKGTLTG